MAQAAAAAFGPNAPGFVIVILVMLGVGSWLAEMITSAVGKGQISAMIRTGTTIAAILAVVAVAWQLLTKFFDFTVGKM
ncbi:hypothetical protein [Desulfosporosinus sp. OT]|uniref:hypothetical protein n=1 Tax=Desulfosporosinus sp. OT TaxID=913865 RepID=UPI000223A50D|nr:hypothetical protein [Desulfosporosinus sp. OT]EGW36437.1 putative membrane protein [Desulfosporosinus sp. OT]